MKSTHILCWFMMLVLFGCGSGEGQSSKLGYVFDSLPSSPSGLAVTAGSGKNTLSWNNVSGATSYNVYWTATPGVTTTSGTKISKVTTPYTHMGLSNGSTYYYIVTAESGAGESSSSTVVQSTAIAIPTATGSGTAIAASTQNNINWSSVSGATGYNLYWSTTTGVTAANGTKIANVTAPYSHTGLSNGTTYYYVLTAYNLSGEGPSSTEFTATTVPSSPTGATVTASSWQSSLTWNNVIGATGYNIYWSTTAGVTTTNGTKVVNATTPYSHTGLSNATTYYYIVTAYNTSGESTPSGEFFATTVPNFPTGVVAVAGNWQNSISWSSSSGATGYNIYWSTTPGVTIANGTKIANVTSTYSQTGLTNATTYYYIVTAYNNAGESTASSEFLATTVPNSPATASTIAGNGQNVLNWSNSAGAVSYNIYWSNNAALTTANGIKIANVTAPYYHTGLTNGTPYYYTVTASSVAGESTASNVQLATPTAPVPPIGVTASLVGSTITLSWQPVVGATSYNIYWGLNQGTTTASSKLATTANTTYEHTGLSSGSTYYYIVTSNFASGQELASVEVVGSVPSGLNSAREAEPNNIEVAANDIYINGGEMRGQLSSSTDVDYFKFVSTGGNVAFTITPASTQTPSGSSARVSLIAQDGTVINSNKLNDGGATAVLTLIGNTVAGETYYLKFDFEPGTSLLQKDYIITSNYIIMNREIESNNDIAKATPLALGRLAGEMRGQLSSKTDIDYFKFVSTGGNVNFTIFPSKVLSSSNFIRATIKSQAGDVIYSNKLYEGSSNGGLTLIGNTVSGGTYYLILDSDDNYLFSNTFQQDYIITSN